MKKECKVEVATILCKWVLKLQHLALIEHGMIDNENLKTHDQIFKALKHKMHKIGVSEKEVP